MTDFNPYTQNDTRPDQNCVEISGVDVQKATEPPLKYNMEEAISKYMSPNEYQEFRRLQVTTGAIISGSFSFGFLAGITVQESDLNIYVETNHGYELYNWMICNGFTVQDEKSTPKSTYEEHLQKSRPPVLMGANTFERNGTNIRITYCCTSPMEAILNFQLTGLMTFITYNRGYCLYPYGTFVQQKMMQNGEGPVTMLAEKYARLGWAIEKTFLSVTPEIPSHPAWQGSRMVGDDKTWIVDLPNPLHVPRPNLIEAHSWTTSFSYDKCLKGWRIKLVYYIVDFASFRHAYTVGDPSIGDIMVKHLGLMRPCEQYSEEEEMSPPGTMFTTFVPLPEVPNGILRAAKKKLPIKSMFFIHYDRSSIDDNTFGHNWDSMGPYIFKKDHFRRGIAVELEKLHGYRNKLQRNWETRRLERYHIIHFQQFVDETRAELIKQIETWSEGEEKVKVFQEKNNTVPHPTIKKKSDMVSGMTLAIMEHQQQWTARKVMFLHEDWKALKKGKDQLMNTYVARWKRI
ncbi:hypothetical protein CVT24_002814 [Panaeolus cyanescens]|uniref:Uncharacterized protein n=1 Tax=Panaeolus cyanescens TaxID=181874 RepID=A0A409YY23_9AGAR|nr:hypothetical protein CVT24_002814 [Panaeolus cyanescens]